MRVLTELETQLLTLESPTTTGHVGSLVLLDPATSPGGSWGVDDVRAVMEARLHLAPQLRQRLVEVPLGLGPPSWVEDPHFDIEFHLREVALPAPGTSEQLGEQVARLHARPLDRTRPLWEAYAITGLEDGRSAFYSKIHLAAVDGVTGAELLDAATDLTAEPRDVEPEEPTVPDPLPSQVEVLGSGLRQLALSPLEVLRTAPKALSYLDRVPGAARLPGIRLVSEASGWLGRMVEQRPPDLVGSAARPPRTPMNGPITAHRRFAFGSLSLSDLERAQDHFELTLSELVMTLTSAALRRWLLDHDALPSDPIVAAVPVFSGPAAQPDPTGDEVSVAITTLPTDQRDPVARAEVVRMAMRRDDPHSEVAAASLPTAVPTGAPGMAARALIRLATVPGRHLNLCVSTVTGPQVPLFIAGARVEEIFPVSAVTDSTGGLSVSSLSYDGRLDVGLIACREMVPDVGNLVSYLQDALVEMLDAVPD
ncbi:wax ester/triacylglycerol synthase family O-acyltransferase [soil metagenome]